MRHTATRLATIVAGGALLLTACGGGSGFDKGSAAASGSATESVPAASGGDITVLIGSSGEAETDAVTKAVQAWSDKSGVKATVNVASDLNQELAQGFAAGSPPDVFYTSTDQLAGYVANGSLYAYGDKAAAAGDFFPSLKDNFTVDGTFYCAPKDFSTLALIINTAAWSAAGLTDGDIPTDWDSLAAAAKKLTTADQVGLSFGPEYQRLGVFMKQAGGGLIDDTGKKAIVDSAENEKALTFVQQMLKDGVLKFPSQVDSGWGGEAFGTKKAAMTIEGNWIVGAMKSNYPDVTYKVAPLPAGPGGKGTLQFTNCWGIAADSDNQGGAVELVDFLTSTDQQLAFADAFGVMPSVQSAADQFRTKFADQAAFLDSVDFASGMPTVTGATDVISDFNGKIEGLATADVKGVLSSVQGNLQAALDSAG
ncbi:MAG TPA: extracellular solute-binding protein [Actinotalea sp.]